MGGDSLEGRDTLTPLVKECSECGVPAPTQKFQSNQAKCAPCRSAADKRRRYGLTRKQYSVLMRVKKCQICRAPEDLHIDHDHGTGKVRGLLCRECNLGLGKFKDDPNLLRAAVRYFASHHLNLLAKPKNETTD